MSTSSQYLRDCLRKLLTSGAAIALGVTVWSHAALAYRPFDGTDAAVAAKGEMEIELQPAGRLRDESGTSLIAPATVINYGLTEDWEAVLEASARRPSRRPGRQI